MMVEPHWLLIGGLGAKFDFRLSDSVSFGIGGMGVPDHSTSSTDSNGKNKETYNFSTYEVYMGPTFMLTGDYDHHGVFLSPAIGYTGAKISNYSEFKLSGQMDSAELRITTGYQWVVRNFRFVAGAGYRAINSTDVIVRDRSGAEVYRERSSVLSGFVIDAGAGILF
ncbi:MAG: hypothetical protein AB7F86_15795 [Bdellovibrionales bacterium]